MGISMPHQESAPTQIGAPGIIEVWDLNRLKPNPLNPRGELSRDDPWVIELSESIKAQGLKQPIGVVPSGYVVYGHRRRLACEIAGVMQVRVVVEDLSEQDQLSAMIAENVQRRDLDPLQEAKGYQALKATGLTNQDVARRTGVNSQHVAQMLKIAAFPADIGHLFKIRQIPVSAASPLSEIENEEDLRRIVGMVVSRRLSVPELERLIKKEFGPKRQKRNYERKDPRPKDRPKGVVRDLLLNNLAAKGDESLKVRDLLREMDYVCCACGMADTAESQATLCAACPLAAFLNRFAKIEVSKVSKRNDLLAQTA